MASGPGRCSAPTGPTRSSSRCCWPTAVRSAPWRCSSRRTRSTGTSPAPPAPRWRPDGGPTTSRSTSTRCAGWWRPSSPVITFLCSPNNPTGRAEPVDAIESVLALTPGLLVVDEAYGQFAPSSALDLVRRGGAGADRVVVVRTFSKTWSLAGLRLGYLVGPPDVVRACELVALPYHLDAAKQLAGRLALQYVDEMETGWPCSTRSGAGSPPPCPPSRSRRWPSDANFILFRPPRRAAREVWGDLLDAIRPRARLFGVAGARPGACGSRWASRRERPVPGRTERKPAMSAPRRHPPRRGPGQSCGRPRRRPSTWPSTSTAPASPTSPPVCPSSTTWSASSAATGGST